MGHGMAAQRRDMGTCPPAGRDGTHGARTPPTAGSLPICPSTCPSEPRLVLELGACEPGWTSHRSISLTKLEVPSGSLKGSRFGSARQRALSPEDGQGPRPLCPCLGHSDPSIRGVVGAGLVTTSGHGCSPHRCSPRPLKAQLWKLGHQQICSQWPSA